MDHNEPKVLRYIELFERLAHGQCLVTANDRLARTIQAEWDSHHSQYQRGWRSATVYSLSHLLDELWNKAQIINAIPAGYMRLRAAQEDELWREFIGETARSLSLPLISPAATARGAQRSWQLMQEYEIALEDQRFGWRADSHQFQEWARAFDGRLKAERWIDRGRAWRLIDWSRMTLPGEMVLVGFDVLTPAQRTLASEWGAVVLPGVRNARVEPRCMRLADREQEVRQAAAWAKGMLVRTPRARLAVIVPDLEQAAAQVERIFSLEMDPDGSAETPWFELSVVGRLSGEPMMAAALSLIGLLSGRVTMQEWSQVLRSPFLGRGVSERSRRAALDMRLRREAPHEFPVGRLLDWEMAAGPGEKSRYLREAIGKLLPMIEESEGRHTRRRWAQGFERVLALFGWPGERPLNSREYQAREAWSKALAEFVSVDQVSGPATLGEARALLQGLVTEARFQPESQGAPVQVMGLYEAAGLECDAAWVLGLHGGVWPGPARPDPFLPIEIQRELRMPNATVDVNTEQAQRVTARLAGCGREGVIFSSPERDREVELELSPLLAEWPVQEASAVNPLWIETWERQWLGVMDEQAPAVLSRPKSGSSLFKDQAACAFRAYAIHRLKAREFEEPAPAISAKDRGIALHKALQIFWESTQSRAGLLALTKEQQQQRVAESVRTALDIACAGDDQAWQLAFRQLEQQVLEGRIDAWLEIERQRAPFRILEQETERPVAFGGLDLTVRLDRVDEAGGKDRVMLIDYKTGQPQKEIWDGERPIDPQLPLYAVLMEEKVAGLVIGRLRVEGASTEGLTTLLDGFGRESITEQGFKENVAEWRRVLEKLAKDFLDGKAEVDPREKPDACQYCHLTALCRRHEEPAEEVRG